MNILKALSFIPLGFRNILRYIFTFFHSLGMLSSSSYAGARSASISFSSSFKLLLSESSGNFPLLDNASGPPFFLLATCLISKENILIQASHLLTTDSGRSDAG